MLLKRPWLNLASFVFPATAKRLEKRFSNKEINWLVLCVTLAWQSWRCPLSVFTTDWYIMPSVTMKALCTEVQHCAAGGRSAAPLLLCEFNQRRIPTQDLYGKNIYQRYWHGNDKYRAELQYGWQRALTRTARGAKTNSRERSLSIQNQDQWTF